MSSRLDIFIHFCKHIITHFVGLFSSFSQLSFLDGKFIPFQLFLFMKGLIFYFLHKFFPIFSLFNATVVAYWKHLSSSLIGFMVAFLFLIQSRESIYNPPHFRYILWHLGCSKLTQSKMKSLHPIDVSNPVWYLLRSCSKISLITSSASSLTRISMLSLF